MANSHIINNIYNHYLTSYAPKKSSHFNTHQKSELRTVYNNIIKMNKISPLFQPDTNPVNQKFAIEMKENSNELRNSMSTISKLSELDFYAKKVLYSSNEMIASITNSNSIPDLESDSSFELNVNNLATPQINLGKPLFDSKTTLLAGDYSFDIDIHNEIFELQFTVSSKDTNKALQERVSNLINTSNIGLSANIITDENNYHSLEIRSNDTGQSMNHSSIFKINDSSTLHNSGSASYLGIDQILSESANAEYEIDGVPHTSTSNKITIGNDFEVTLNSVATLKDKSTYIGVKADASSLSDDIMHLFNSYNSFVETTSDYVTSQPKTTLLLNDLKKISNNHKTSLKSIGLSLETDGTININQDMLTEAISSASTNNLFDSVKGFAESIIKKTEQISLNPLEYTNRKMCSYKNPNQPTATPYITSAYSGMLFNSYS